VIGGSDAGIAAALRARELDTTVEATLVVADAYPNFSICGLPYYLSGDVADWRSLAHRTTADLGRFRIRLRSEPSHRCRVGGDRGHECVRQWCQLGRRPDAPFTA
jgi:hypothetical protein